MPVKNVTYTASQLWQSLGLDGEMPPSMTVMTETINANSRVSEESYNAELSSRDTSIGNLESASKKNKKRSLKLINPQHTLRVFNGEEPLPDAPSDSDLDSDGNKLSDDHAAMRDIHNKFKTLADDNAAKDNEIKELKNAGDKNEGIILQYVEKDLRLRKFSALDKLDSGVRKDARKHAWDDLVPFLHSPEGSDSFIVVKRDTTEEMKDSSGKTVSLSALVDDMKSGEGKLSGESYPSAFEPVATGELSQNNNKSLNPSNQTTQQTTKRQQSSDPRDMKRAEMKEEMGLNVP